MFSVAYKSASVVENSCENSIVFCSVIYAAKDIQIYVHVDFLNNFADAGKVEIGL